MSVVPELVFQNGVRMAWKFLEEYPRVVGFLLDELPVDVQQDYKEQILADKMSTRVVFTFPKSGVPPLPFTTVVPMSKQADINFLGDGGRDSYNPETLPHPPVAPEDFPDIERYYGLLHGLTTKPQKISRGGDRSTDRTTHHDQIKLNRGIQRFWGDDQRKEMGAPQKIFNALTQYIEGKSHIDRVTVTAQVRADNGEKTLIYTALLVSVLREYSLWFHLNGLMNPQFSVGGLSTDNLLGPSTSGDPPLMREITMSFQHEDRFHEIRPVIAKFIIDVNMITLNNKGEEESTDLVEVEVGNSVATPPPSHDSDS